MIRILLLSILLASCGTLRRKSVSAPAANPRRADLEVAYERNLAALEGAGYLCPPYVRGAPLYCAVHWLYAAHVVLQYSEGN